MTHPWSLYQRSPSFVLGFHGSDKAIVDAVLTGATGHLRKSEGRYEWLGHGIYFWESDPQRGLEWAQSGHSRQKARDPDVVGAVIDLGHCLDLTTRMALDEIASAFKTLKEVYRQEEKPLPSNNGGADTFRRELDCQVIQAVHRYRIDKGLVPYDSVRAPFPEDRELYDGAGFRLHNHIQIAIINTECIKGYFRPLKNA